MLSRHQNVGQDRDIKIANRSFENVSQFIYLGTKVTNTILIQEEIKSILNSGDRLCGLVVRVLGYRSGDPGSIPDTTKKNVMGLERGPLSLDEYN
jgi:hypothetical protein